MTDPRAPHIEDTTVDHTGDVMSLDDVAGELSISRAQAYALVRRGDLRAVKVGGHGQWRVERTGLEDYIAAAHRIAESFVAAHPFGLGDKGMT